MEIYLVVQRIAVTGPVGAGKSRLASELGEALAIRVLHLDALFWKPGWVASDRAGHEAMQRREVAADSWIVDAQPDDMLPDWLQAADTVVFVDASLLRSLWRVTKRRLDRRPNVGTPNGEPGALHRSVLKYARNQWQYRTKVRRELLAELERERNGRQVVVVRGDDDAAAFLRRVDSRARARGTV